MAAPPLETSSSARSRYVLSSTRYSVRSRALDGFTLHCATMDKDWRPACANCGSLKAAEKHGTKQHSGVYRWTQWAKSYVDPQTGDRFEAALCSGCDHRVSSRGQSTPFSPSERAELHRRVLAYFSPAGAPPPASAPAAIDIAGGRTRAFKPARDDPDTPCRSRPAKRARPADDDVDATGAPSDAAAADAPVMAADMGAEQQWMYRSPRGVFGPFTLVQLQADEAGFRRLRMFPQLRVWRMGEDEAGGVLLSGLFDAAG
jgi:hypothetical protein